MHALFKQQGGVRVTGIVWADTAEAGLAG